MVCGACGCSLVRDDHGDEGSEYSGDGSVISEGVGDGNGTGVRWYCWAGEGRLRVSCRECWVRSTLVGDGGVGFDGVWEGEGECGRDRGGGRVSARVRRVVGAGAGCVVS